MIICISPAKTFKLEKTITKNNNTNFIRGDFNLSFPNFNQ